MILLCIQMVPYTIKTRVNDPCARTFELTLLVRSGVLFFFFARGADFWCVFCPLFQRRKFQTIIPSIRMVHSSSYGILGMSPFSGVLLWVMELPKEAAPIELQSKLIREAVSKHKRQIKYSCLRAKIGHLFWNSFLSTRKRHSVRAV